MNTIALPALVIFNAVLYVHLVKLVIEYIIG